MTSPESEHLCADLHKAIKAIMVLQVFGSGA
jgi:hypothetical protein